NKIINERKRSQIMTNKLVLIDGNSLLYRAYYALPLLHNDKGVYTNAVYGFSNILFRIIEEEQPTHMLVAFDAGKTTFRHSTYKEYKGGRQKTPPELSEQFPVMKEALQAFQIPTYELELYEADDIIGTLAYQAGNENWDVKVISGDRDLLQLITDQVTVDVTKKGVSEVESFTPETLLEKMEVTPEQVIELKALMGDNSDNIPGVPGVGVKTATKLIKQFGTLEKVYTHIDEVSGKKLKENLTSHEEDARMSHDLVTIDRNAPIQITLEDVPYSGYDRDKLYDLFSDLEFRTLLEKLGGSSEERESETEEVDYEVVEEITEDMFTSETTLFAEMLTENYHTASIKTIALVNRHNAYVIETQKAVQSDIFKAWAEDASQNKCVFDAKAVRVAFLPDGIDLQGIDFDMMLAAYLINPADKNDEIAPIARRNGFSSIKYNEEVYGKGKKLAVPEEAAAFYSHVIRKTNAMHELQGTFKELLDENNMNNLFTELELPLASIL